MGPQEELFFDSAEDALASTVSRLGGYKKVGGKMRPELSAESAESWLKKCLKENGAERLNPSQVELLSRMGRDIGCHYYMAYLASTLGYQPPVALTPEALQHETLLKGVEAMTQVHALVESLRKQGLDLNSLMKGVGK
jgi:hypothetical protein